VQEFSARHYKLLLILSIESSAKKDMMADNSTLNQKSLFKKLPMASTYYEYLKSLSKEQLVKLIFKPIRKRADCPGNACRKVALKLSYDGRNYKGVQYHPFLKTISDSLYNALEITNLRCDVMKYSNFADNKDLEDAKDVDDLVFCGRTDAGVSAINMVVSLTINSHLETPNKSYDIKEEDYKEYPYDVILNQHLPEDIRIVGWAPVPDDFSARYDCVQRHYRYYFLLKDLNLQRMKDCAKTVSEMDDFYCLSTHSNPKAIYKRKLDEIGIYKLENLTDDTETCFRENGDEKCKGDDIYYLEIKACGFLHNMVRKIFWLIQNSGKNNAFSLKNVQIASPFPLVFVGAKFKNTLNFITSDRQNKIRFIEEAEDKRVQQVISCLRLEKYKDYFDK